MALRCKTPAATCAASSRRSVRVAAHKGAFEQVQVAAAAVVAAAVIASPANAGVVLQQPELKKVFQSDASAPAPVKREFRGMGAAPAAVDAPKVAAEKPKKAESSGESSGGLDPRSVALPGALILSIGGFFAASKIDTSFNAWFMEAFVRDSNNYAGYEATLKSDAGVTFPKAASGTKKVKAASPKKGGFPNPFGKK